jgi:hypothetical protein
VVQAVLSVGTHTLRLSVTNAAGRSAAASVRLHVVSSRRANAIFLPELTVTQP